MTCRSRRGRKRRRSKPIRRIARLLICVIVANIIATRMGI